MNVHPVYMGVDASQSSSVHAFMNALRILHSMEPNWLPVEFVRDPVAYLMRADEPTLNRVWAAIQARQPARYREAG